jgi:hypothetical protein
MDIEITWNRGIATIHTKGRVLDVISAENMAEAQAWVREHVSDPQMYVAPFTFRYSNKEFSGEVIHKGGEYRIADPVLSRFVHEYRVGGHSGSRINEWIFPHPTSWEFEWSGEKITVGDGVQ